MRRPEASGGQRTAEVEREYIAKKLEEHDWNITQAAQALGVERTNLHKKIKQHGLSRHGRGPVPDVGGADEGGED